MSAGFFLVLEGIDGCGTTTQAGLLADRLRAGGRSVTLTREPTKGPIGRFLRSALSDKLEEGGKRVQLGWDSMALLFTADRLDHLAREVMPALARGEVVISDRYTLSSLIYQSATSPEGAASLPWLRALNEKARVPDLTIVLDVPAEAAEARRAVRDEEAEIFENLDLQLRLRELYKDASEVCPGEAIEVISGVGTIEEVAARIDQLLAKKV